MARERARRLSPLEWNRRFLPDYFARLPPADFHADLAAAVDGLHLRRRSKLARIAPRGGAKSTWWTLAYPLRCALEGWEPYTLILSDSSDQAEKLLGHIRKELEENPTLLAVYPDAAGPGPEWKEGRLRLRNGSVIESLGSGKKVRGRRNRSARPSLVIFDDIQSNEDAASPTLRTKAWNWATREVIPAGDENTNFLSVGSALHRDCVAVKLGKLAGWSGRTFRAVHSWPERMDLWERFDRLATNLADDDRLETAKAFFAANEGEMSRGFRGYWPERWPVLETMLQRAEVGRAGYECEYQGVPGSPDGAAFPPELFDDERLWFDEFPHDLLWRVQSLDPSSGADSKAHDFQAHVDIGMDRSGDLWVDADLRKERIAAMVARALDRALGFAPLDSLAVENNDSLGMLLPEFREQIAARGLVLPLQGVHQKQGKEFRVLRLLAYLERGQVRFRRTPGTRLLVDQLKDFPLGDHDDGPDALELAVRRLEMLTGGVG